MKILLYRYGSICEPDIIDAFTQIGLNIIEETTEITTKKISPAQRVQLVDNVLKREHPLFVFSVNFYPDIAQICHIYKTPYLCWTVDSPVPELFAESMQLPSNRIFLFDRAQYDCFAPFNPNCTFHLPLASAVKRFDQVIGTITETDRKTYSSDISFVGSLYSEKNPMHQITDLSEYTKGYVDALVEAALKIYGYNPVESAMTDALVCDIKGSASDFYSPGASVANSDKYVAAHSYIGMQIAETERIRTLNLLAGFYDVDLYTLSDTSPLQGVHIRGGANSLTEMPKIFHLSKINLNMTIKPIQTGLPLRIFDILGCGGFLMTNYQTELTEHFEIGVDLEAYASIEELVDKCAYYLEHEDVRHQIARNGYRKVCENHTYIHRIKEMIKATL